MVSDDEFMLCNLAAESHLLELNWVVNYWKKKDFGQLVFMISLAASINYLWKERKNRVFQHKCLVSEEVILKTGNDIRLKLTSLDQAENSLRTGKSAWSSSR